MKIMTLCVECVKELGHPSFEPIFADYFDDAIATVKCSRGHESVLMLQGLRFEILLESGALAYLDGYTLEASSSFSAALERFFEFCIRVFCKGSGIKQEDYKKSFKQIASQSQRQVGAFLYLYLSSFGNSYEMNNEITEFRNKVIHKGYIPTPEQTEKFAELVYCEIHDITLLLREKYPDQIQQVIQENLTSRRKSISAEIPVATTTGIMFFSLAQSELKPTFQDALKGFKKAIEVIDGAVSEMKRLSKLFKKQTE